MPRSTARRRAAAAALTTLTSLGLVAPMAPATSAAASGPQPTACPEQVADLADCYSGRDDNGAYYAIAVPHDWEGDLVVHAHGGPDLEDPTDASRSLDDLGRWSVMVREGYAWAGSTYRRGGYGVRMAAADTESVRDIFVDRFGRPGRTLLHGQSWGGNVAAKVAETTKKKRYDGVLLTNGVMAGGTRGYDYRVDLRVIYQYYCRNLPRPNEQQYPVWQGLRPGSTLTSAGLRSRLQECTGYQSEPSERTALQQRNLDDILAVTRIPERTLESHLRFSVFTFRDIVQRLDGENPFDNRTVRYSGSHDDRALNRGVERFRADRTAKRDLSWDSDLTGDTTLPTLSLHAVGDPTAFVEHESAYRETRRGARTDRSLAQVFTEETEHSALSDAEYAAAVRALAAWTEGGRKPTPERVAKGCAEADAVYGTGCFVDTDYRPASYASRVEPRPGGRTWPALSTSEERRWSRVPGVGIAP